MSVGREPKITIDANIIIVPNVIAPSISSKLPSHAQHNINIKVIAPKMYDVDTPARLNAAQYSNQVITAKSIAAQANGVPPIWISTAAIAIPIIPVIIRKTNSSHPFC